MLDRTPHAITKTQEQAGQGHAYHPKLRGVWRKVQKDISIAAATRFSVRLYDPAIGPDISDSDRNFITKIFFVLLLIVAHFTLRW